jgi:DNA polymerase III subunit epsilon
VSLDFVAFDVETANYDRGSICAAGWAVVRDSRIVDTGSFLCRPPEPVYWFDPWISTIHGITEPDVRNQPGFGEIVPRLLASFGDLPVIAHNAAFDVGALREAHTYSEIPWPTLSYGCTLVWSRRLLKLPSYRLPIVCNHLGVPLDHHHDAGADARAAAQITVALALMAKADSVDALLHATWSRLGRLWPSEWSGCRVRDATSQSLPQANPAADPANPFYGQTVVFTGGLACMFRKDAWQYVAEAGGVVNEDVTKRTTLLVLGDGFRAATTIDELLTTAKAMKAWQYHQRGQPIEFWSEIDFVQALTGANVARNRAPGTPTPTHSGDPVVSRG